jgi:membrane protease YdiL (CAAX protease family)
MLEVAALAVATVVFLATFRVRASYVDFALAGVAVALIVTSAGRSRRLWELGRPVSTDSRAARYRSATLLAAAFTAVALVALAGLAFGWPPAGASEQPVLTRLFNAHFFIAMLLYFPWALLQQYIFQFYLFGRLLHLVPVALGVALTAAAFASVHFPRWPVMAVTLVAGTAWTLIYYRHRVLLPLAASHAVLGAALHYWVFGHDLLEAWLP